MVRALGSAAADALPRFSPGPQRREHERALAADPPASVFPRLRGSSAAVLRILAGPPDLPRAFGRRREERLGDRVATKIGAKIHNQQSIVAMVLSEEPER